MFLLQFVFVVICKVLEISFSVWKFFCKKLRVVTLRSNKFCNVCNFSLRLKNMFNITIIHVQGDGPLSPCGIEKGGYLT